MGQLQQIVKFVRKLQFLHNFTLISQKKPQFSIQNAILRTLNITNDKVQPSLAFDR